MRRQLQLTALVGHAGDNKLHSDWKTRGREWTLCVTQDDRNGPFAHRQWRKLHPRSFIPPGVLTRLDGCPPAGVWNLWTRSHSWGPWCGKALSVNPYRVWRGHVHLAACPLMYTLVLTEAFVLNTGVPNSPNSYICIYNNCLFNLTAKSLRAKCSPVENTLILDPVKRENVDFWSLIYHFYLYVFTLVFVLFFNWYLEFVLMSNASATVSVTF